MRPVVVELVGAPGAGKTTVVPLVENAIRDAGLTPRTTPEVARDLAARGWVGRIARMLPGRVRRRVLWLVYLVEATALGARVVAGRGPLRSILLGQRRRPSRAMVSQRGVVGWFVRYAGTEQLFRRRALTGEVFVADEGYVHRAVQLFSSAVERPAETDLLRYLDAAPHPTVVVMVDTPPEQCLERIVARGVWDRFADQPAAELVAFVDNAAFTASASARAARQLGIRVVTLSNAGQPAVAKGQMQTDLKRGLAVPRWRFRPPTWAPPRAGIVSHKARSVMAPTPLSVSEMHHVLHAVDVRPTGSVHGFTTGRRSAISAVATDVGRLVVKRYADHWSSGSIQHEHAVLDRLAEVDFPAVRLVASPDGRTAVTVGESTFTVFRYVDGMTYGGRHLSDRRLRDLYTDLGELLARLHSDLEGFETVHRHHLGFSPGPEGHDGGLEWYLERLAHLRDAAAAGDMPPAAMWLADRAADLTDRLREIDARLGSRGLSSTIIHGDFGTHNVLYGMNGPVLHDFELARTEWRLTEIVMLLARLRSPVAKRSIIEAYRAQADMDDSEWDLLPDVWRHYFLTAAIRSWNTYVLRGDVTRLDRARSRVERTIEGMG